LNSSEAFLQRIYGGRGPQSILFFGAPGAGQLGAARRLAQFWLCKNPQAEGACGECPACRSYLAGRAVDAQEIAPYGAARQIKLGAIYPSKTPESEFQGIPVIEYFRTRPLLARHKVVIFDQAERMNSAAAHALLKTLEEPNPSARMILVTSELGSLLPTIRSRCACISCSAVIDPAPEDIAIFGDSPESRARLDEAPEAYREIAGILADADHSPRAAALKLSERLRGAAEKLGKETGWSARMANAEAARCTARWLVSRNQGRTKSVAAAVEAHRLIDANGNAAIIFDQLMSSILE
jgi:DNA polymerase-3 subunit delta'